MKMLLTATALVLLNTSAHAVVNVPQDCTGTVTLTDGEYHLTDTPSGDKWLWCGASIEDPKLTRQGSEGLPRRHVLPHQRQVLRTRRILLDQDHTRQTRRGMQPMKRLLATAALALIATAAQAGKFKPMPIEFVGQWCSADSDGSEGMNYRLPSWMGDNEKCTDILQIDQYGFSYGDNNCHPLSMRLKKDRAPSGTAYTATLTALCTGPNLQEKPTASTTSLNATRATSR